MLHYANKMAIIRQTSDDGMQRLTVSLNFCNGEINTFLELSAALSSVEMVTCVSS